MTAAVVIIAASVLSVLGSLVPHSTETFTVASVITSIVFHAIYMFAVYKRCQRTPKRNAPWVIAIIIFVVVLVDVVVSLKFVGQTITSPSAGLSVIISLIILGMSIALIVLTRHPEVVDQ
jgi:hypothetical protein